jgi:hypothetical protein
VGWTQPKTQTGLVFFLTAGGVRVHDTIGCLARAEAEVQCGGNRLTGAGQLKNKFGGRYISKHEGGMRRIWNSRVRRVLWLWFVAFVLGFFVMAAVVDLGETGSLGWRRILMLVVAGLLNVQAICNVLWPTSESSGGNTARTA